MGVWFFNGAPQKNQYKKNKNIFGKFNKEKTDYYAFDHPYSKRKALIIYHYIKMCMFFVHAYPTLFKITDRSLFLISIL